MPFRTNFFGEKIAQPDTELSEIEDTLMDRYGATSVELTGADQFTNGDDEFKFGGTLHFQIEIEEGEDDDGDPITGYSDATMEFDGFASYDDARAFLIGLGIADHSIMEVD